jgi:hypothetical protein
VRAKIAASAEKPTKADENENAAFCFLLFFRIGTFQWVAADSNPFFLPPLIALPQPLRTRPALAHVFQYSAISDFVKIIRLESVFQVGAGGSYGVTRWLAGR